MSKLQNCTLPLDLQFLPHQVHNNRMGLGGCAPGVYDVHSLWFASRDGQVSVADPSEESAIFLFESIFVLFRYFFRAGASVFPIAPPGAFQAEGNVIVEQDREVGLQVATEDFVQLQHGLRPQLAASTLIGFG